MNNISLKNNNIELSDILETVNSLSSGKEEQEKSIEITENGTNEIIPDDGKTLFKVTVTTNIESIGGDITEERSKWINRSWIEFNDNEVSSVGNYTFANCTSLTLINLPVCTSIGNYAFATCSSLTSVDLPVCTSIGNSAFMNCSSLASIDLPACNFIGSYAFQFCSSLTSVNLPVCTVIGSQAFYYCTPLTSVNLPVCSYINYQAFYYCSSLTSVDLPACNLIGSYAFRSCHSLTSLTLGYSSVAKLSNINAFQSTPMSMSTLIGTFGSIYVPASLVDAYKSATNWTTYADRITAIVE